MAQPQLVTGGAPGADCAWARAACDAGSLVTTLSFRRHLPARGWPDGATIDRTEWWAPHLAILLRRTAALLDRPCPGNQCSYTSQLHRRDMRIATSVQRVYAVAALSPPTARNMIGIEDDTAWPVVAFALTYLDMVMTRRRMLTRVPVFVYNIANQQQQQRGWHQLHLHHTPDATMAVTGFSWEPIESPPSPRAPLPDTDLLVESAPAMAFAGVGAYAAPPEMLCAAVRVWTA